jgi:hypothetical protein
LRWFGHLKRSERTPKMILEWNSGARRRKKEEANGTVP